MKTVSLAGFETIKQACPNARIEVRDGVEVVVIPTYDFDNDVSGENVLKLVRPEGAPKFQPGQELRHTQTGVAFNIVDPIVRMLKLRKGPKADD